MRALVYRQYSPGDCFDQILKVEEIDDPAPGIDEVVFKVRAAALNYNDIWGMRGYPIAVPLPHVSGSDAAGEVIAVGENVKNIKVGDRVVSYSNISCGFCKACIDGRGYNCANRIVWGFQTGPLWGAFSEITRLPVSNVVKIPDGVTFDEAAAASMVLLTSWHMLVTRAGIRPGMTVLIMGGGSGVGSFGIQIAKLYECDVIATCSPDKIDRCLELGADYAINHKNDTWDKEVRAITRELAKRRGDVSGVDISFDHIGKTHWNKQLALLKYGGTLVTCGATTGYEAETDLRQIFFKGVNVLGSTQGTKAELEQGLYWMSKGRIRAAIDSIYPLEGAAEAHSRMLQGGAMFGKILLRPGYPE